MRKRAAGAAVLDIEVSASLPEFREKFLIERCLEITDAFRAAGATLGADHAFDHLDMVRAPQRKILVVFHQRFCQLKLFVTILEVREDLEYCLRPLADINSRPLEWR